MFKALDEDNVEYVAIEKVRQFTKDVMRGKQVEGQENTSFEGENEECFAILEKLDSEFCNEENLGIFFRQLVKDQIRLLQKRIEKQYYERCLTKVSALNNAA